MAKERDWAEEGKFAGEHARIRKMKEPKDIFTEEDIFNHIGGNLKEKADNDIVFAATLQELFRFRYEYNYWRLEKVGLTAEDIENTVFDINLRIDKLSNK